MITTQANILSSMPESVRLRIRDITSTIRDKGPSALAQAWAC